MKLLFYSPAFLPKIGGLELTVANLAEGLAELGYQVVVVTTTPSDALDDLPYPVVRQPGPLELVRWVRWCDVFFQKNVSLRGLWPLLLVRRPWVVSHHSWYCRSDGRVAWQDRLKRWLLRFATASISVSDAVAADLDTPSVVIPNAYRMNLFRLLGETERDGDLLFVGRLVSDKGCDLLLDALALLAERGVRPRLTVVGEGPERSPLVAQADRLGLGSQIVFTGLQRDEELVRMMNRNRVLVVPSRYNEPFGIVALEGMACGCVIVGSEGGGLRQAIGPGGLTFANGDREALAEALIGGLELAAANRSSLAPEVAAHLSVHSSTAVAARYAEELQEISGVRPSGSKTSEEGTQWARNSS